jgi:hypothetical protein
MSQKTKQLASILAVFAGHTFTPKMFAELLKREMPDAISAIGNTPVYYSVKADGSRADSYASYPVLFDAVANGYKVRETSEMLFPVRKGRGESAKEASAALDALIAKVTAPKPEDGQTEGQTEQATA